MPINDLDASEGRRVASSPLSNRPRVDDGRGTKHSGDRVYTSKRECDHMLRPEDEFIPNTRPSCTESEVVARLIGWLKGPIVPRYILITEDGIPADQLPLLTSLDESIDKYLYDIRERARRELLEAAASGASNEILEQKEGAIKEIDELIRKTYDFRLDVADEAAREDSTFLIDRRETDRTGVVHYTLASVDRWTRKQYGVSIMDASVPAKMGVEQKDGGREDGGDGKEDDFSRQVFESLQVSFALLVEALAERVSAFKSGEGPNAKAIAEHIEKRAKLQAGGDVRGQGRESLRKRIAAAMSAKDKRLRDL